MENPSTLIGKIVYLGADTTEFRLWNRLRESRTIHHCPTYKDLKLVVGVDIYMDDYPIIAFHDGDGWAADNFEKYWVELV